MHKLSLEECKVIPLRKIDNDAGSITPVENHKDLPFEVKRVFYLYDIKGGEERGNHAHKACHQFLVAASGSFEVIVDNGKEKKAVFLNRADVGLHIPPGFWATEVNFSSGSICLVLASHAYDEEDYFRNYEEYLAYYGRG